MKYKILVYSPSYSPNVIKQSLSKNAPSIITTKITPCAAL